MTPTSLFEHALDRLPVYVSEPIRWLYLLFVWITLPLSLLNAISDIRVFLEFCQSVLQSLPDLRPYLIWIGETFHVALLLWRDLTAPVRLWIDDLVPWDMPPVLMDLILLMATTAPSWIRLFFAKIDYEERETLKAQIQKEKEATRSRGKEEGVDGGMGATIGGLIGGALGLLFPPLLPAAIGLGVTVGAGVGSEDDAKREGDFNRKLSHLEAALQDEEARLARAASRMNQARFLVGASVVCVLIAAFVVLIDWRLYGSGL